MRGFEHLPSSARRLIRGLLPVVVAAGAAVTCDSPTGPARHTVAFAIAPVLKLTLGAFGGLSVDQARLIVVKPATDTVATQTFSFSPDSAQITAKVSVTITDTATFWVTVQLLDGNTLLFSGVDTVLVSAGEPSGNPSTVVLRYVGPGAQIASIQIAPRDTGVSFGGQLQYRLTAVDSSESPDTLFYAAWSTTGTANTVNANGLFRAGRTRGTTWVYAHTPTGIKDSTSVTVSPVPSQILIVSGNSQSGVIGTVLPQPLVVKVLAADNLPVSGVTVQFSTSSGSVNPPTAMTDTLGLAQTVVTLGNTAGGVQVSAKVGSVTPAQFTETATQQPGVPANLAKAAGDAQSALVGTAVAIAPQVKVTDAFSTAVSGVSVTFAVASGGGSITGATATTNSSGLASVGSWTLGTTAGTNTLMATVASLTPVTFTATGTAAVAPAIVLTVPGNLVGVGGQGLALVKLTQPAPAGGLTVTVTSDSTSHLTVAAPGTIAFAAGDTLKSITLTGVTAGVSILHATAPGYTAGLTAVAVTPNLIVLQAPFSLAVGQSTSLSIQLLTAAPTGGLVVTLASTDTTKLKVTTPTVTIAAGQMTGSATVQALAVGLVGVTATATGYGPGATAVTVTATAGAPKTLSLVSGGNQSATPGSQLTNPIVVKVADSLGIGVSGYAVTFAVATGGGSVGTPNATTDVNGLASTMWTLGAATGTQTITATATGLTGSPLTVSANVAIIASTTVTPKFDTLTALTGTSQLAAQAKDASGNPLTGSFAWLSRAPAVATVSTSGLVTAVTNGSTYVVATEAGGTKDSAKVVVQQQLASINVSGKASLYLTTSYSFTASGVDGLGKPMPGITSFTWSTTAPAVATVDTANHGTVDTVFALGLGTAQIKATSGTITGVANLSVITPITRIAVVVDTVGATKTDTFTLTSLGLTRRYRAIAHDTLDAVMSGVQSFTWQSTNGSVALLDSTTNVLRSTATSAANGVTNIQATAQGFTSNPGALLTVSQVLASIELKPDSTNPTALVGVGGTMHVSARGKDANNRYISGGTFKYLSATPTVATVDSVTGFVTGVAVGTTVITATSGAITSNSVTVTVANTGVPAILSFGRDTVSVGRGSSAQIPILLSKPSASALTVTLTPTGHSFAHWSPASITIPANQTAANATLWGDSAGTAVVTATDSSGVYASASAVVRVTANMNLASYNYTINTTDVVNTQVLLSDPSPAGGTYVTFSFGTPGVAQVSPNPAFIPAGQLAANIQILAVGAGTTTITPSAIGVNGAAATFTALPPVLTPYPSFILLGQGQYYVNADVQTPTYTYLSVPVALTSSDTTVATVPPTVTIPAGSYYNYFNVTSKGTGSASISVSAPGWTGAYPVSVVVSSPILGVCCSYGYYYTTSPQQNVTVYSEDSTGGAHYRTNSLLVHLRSTDPTVIQLLDTAVTIQPGYSYNNSGRFVMGGLGGSAWIVATASGHQADSVQYTVSGPPLYINFSTTYPPLVGVGQSNSSYYVSTPNYVTQPLVVTLTHSDTAIIGIPATVTIPINSYYASFTVTGKAPGLDTILFTAPGYASVSGSWAVSTPRLTAGGSATVNNFSAGGYVYAYSTDSLLNAHPLTAPLTVTLFNTDTTKIRLDSTSLTIPAGQYYTVQPAHWTPLDTGTAKIIVSAAGYPALPQDTLTINVVTPTLYMSLSSNAAYPNLLGRRQSFSSNGNGFYVGTPDYRASPLAITIVQKHNTVDSLTTTTPTIPVNSYYAYLDAYGLATGGDTLTVSAPGYNPYTAYITVTTPRLTNCCMPGSALTTTPPFGMTVYSTDSVGNGHYSMDTLVIAAASSDSTVIQPAQRSFLLLPNYSYASTTVNVTGPGGPANITYSDSAAGYGSTTTGNITVTGPSLYLSGISMLGMRQHNPNGWIVQVQNYVATPLVVNLLSTGTRVATVPATVTIPANSYYAYFDVTAQDTVGTIQIQATATGYGGATTNVQVTPPYFAIYTNKQLNTTSSRTAITVYAEDQNGSTHYTTENVTVTLGSSAPSVANIDSGTVTILQNQYNNLATWGPGIAGTSQLSATDTRAVFYQYGTGTATVTVNTPTLSLYGPGILGLGQYQDYSYVQAPDYQPSNLAVTFTNSGAAGTFANLTNTPITGVTIPQGQYYTYFRMAGVSRGTDTLTASATSPAHFPATIYTVVDSGTVNTSYDGWPTSLSLSTNDSVNVTLYARDPNNTARPVMAATQFTLASNSNIEFHSAGAVVTQVTIPAAANYVQFWLVGKTAGTGSVTITSPMYKTYSTTVTVTP